MNQDDVTSPKTAAAISGTAPYGSTKVLGRRCIDSASLFEGAREVVIAHHGKSYCLRVTRNEKLILTK